MTATTTPPNVSAYLAQLGEALADLPANVRSEIVEGVAEELAGLDFDTAAAKIRALGDPAFIAAEARAEVAQPPSPTDERVDAATPVAPHAEPAWLAVVAALLVMLGGLIVPVLGWIAGIVLVWRSAAWTSRQKWIATLAPFAVAVILASGIWAARSESVPIGGGFEVNPLIPAAYDLVWASFFGFVPATLISGIWLLVVANKKMKNLSVGRSR